MSDTVTTETELDALALGSVLLDADGDVYRSSEKIRRLSATGPYETVRVYWQAGPQGEFRTVALPATVLHRGGTR